MSYTCNAIHRSKGRLYFCHLQLTHDGDHTDDVKTWPQENFDDEDVPPVW